MLIMHKTILILILFFLTVTSFQGIAQEKTVEISGTIVEAESKAPVPYVHVVNQNTGKGTISNTEGRFWVQIAKTDTLLFSAMGFESYAFTIKKHVNSDKLDVTIELNTSTMELQPVKVFAYKDEQALKRALIAMELPLEQKQSFTSGWTNTKKNIPAGGGISIGGPVSALYNVFSKKHKANKKLKGYQEIYDHQKTIRAKYNEDVVVELTGLPEDKVEEFMNFCKLQDSFIDRSNPYEIAVAVNRCLKDFDPSH